MSRFIIRSNRSALFNRRSWNGVLRSQHNTTKKSLYVSWAPEFYCPLPPGHTFPMKKYQDLYEILMVEGILSESTILAPKEISWEDLELVHTKEYINKFKYGTLTEKDIRTLGVPGNAQMIKRWRMTVAGTVDAALMSLHHGVAGNISGGYHHSFADYGHGYCAFNDTAVAIRKLQKDAWISGISLVVDLDTHQGDGTAKIFENDSSVYTFSMHGQKNFPQRKMQSTLDVHLPDKCTDEEYLSLLQANLQKSLEDCKKLTNKKPDIVFYLAGVDVLQSDKLGRLSVTSEGLQQREQMVLDFFFTVHKIPIVLLTAGGYNSTSQVTAHMHAEVFREAHRLYNKNLSLYPEPLSLFSLFTNSIDSACPRESLLTPSDLSLLERVSQKQRLCYVKHNKHSVIAKLKNKHK